MKKTNPNTPTLPALVLAILLFATSANAAIIFVDVNVVGGANDGSSWANAFSDLQDALSAATSGDEIWVAAGTYRPTPTINRTVSFVMINGVGIYGGFSGTETSLGQRDWVANVCTLSGDIGVQGDSTDNSYHVIFNDQNGLDSTAVLDGFTVTEGNADDNSNPDNGGGGMRNDGSSPTVVNCSFSGNSATSAGGGMYNRNSSSPTVTDCTFSGNSATSVGGGMFNRINSSPTVMYCTFSENTASFGGGMYNIISSSPVVSNCAFSGNSAVDDGGGMYNVDSSPTVTNCSFSGNSASGTGGGVNNNDNSSPTVTNCTFSNNTAVAGGGMYNSPSSSPTVTNCILWGNSTEIENSGGSTPTVTYSIILGGHTGTGNLNADPLFVNAAGDDLHLMPGSPAIDAGTATGAPSTDFDGDPRPLGLGFDMGFDEALCHPGNIAFVKSGATGNNDGTSWTDAFTDLQDALSKASVCNSITEIWVAAGTYHPTPTINRTVSFVMINGVGIYGGFSGTETNLGQRDWVANVTTLSGDIGVQGDSTDNSYHVIFNDNNGLDSTAILDGFTVTAGNADGADSPDNSGGGIYNDSSSPTVANCTFSENTASLGGGGMYNFGADPTVTNCSFSGNSASTGGGMFNIVSDPTVTNCMFSGNSASGSGGGMRFNSFSFPTVTNCSFNGNTASSGGGIVTVSSSINSLILSVTNCTFSGNSADDDSGGMYNFGALLTVTNCILWGNSTEIVTSGGGTTTVTHSIVQGGHVGTGNLNADPLFVNAAGGDLHLLPGSPAIDAGTASGAPATDFDGDVRPLGIGFDMGFDEAPCHPGNILYVKPDATGTNDGTSWTDAFPDLQDALSKASTCSTISDIWVAAGTYHPTTGTDRSVSFEMINGVGIYGGFSGTETSREQRDWVANVCTLSGDIGVQGDDSDNSRHVISNFDTGLSSSAVLDGFTVTAGNADGAGYPSADGGGMFNSGAAPTVANCKFTGNTANGNGGGMYIDNFSGLTVTNCSISGNTAGNGGGMHIDFFSFPTITNCSISENTASGDGGGVNNNGAIPVLLTNCILWGNGTEIVTSGGGGTTVNHSIVQGGHPGTGNLNADPLFVNAAGGDLHLLPGSPAIDVGTATGAPATDYDGDARPSGAGFDMGFDEWQEDCIPPITINWTGGANLWNLPGNWNLGYVPYPCNDVEILMGDVMVPTGFTANGKTLEVGPGASLEVELGAELIVE